MPIRFEIKTGVVLSRFEGSVGPGEVLEWYSTLRSTPGFNSNVGQLAHFQLTMVPNWTASDMKNVLESDPFGEDARRAFVGEDDLVFALSRMFSTFAETEARGGHISVFRSLPDACEWLGLPADTTL